MNVADRGRGPRRSLSRHPAQARQPQPPGRRCTSATGSRTPSASAWCSPTRRWRTWARRIPETNAAMAAAAARWDDIEIHYRGTVLRSTGHRFSGVERKILLELLAQTGRVARGRDPLAAGDPRSLRLRPSRRRPDRRRRRRRQPDPRSARPIEFQPQLDWRRNRFVWLGSTRPFPAFTFYFKPRPRDSGAPTRISTRPVARPSSSRRGRRPGRRADSTRPTRRRRSPTWSSCSSEELQGHRLLANRSIWRRFPTVRNARWHAGNVVLLGDAAHTAHFSVGSGTKLAMEDAIALAAALTARAARSPTRSPLRGRPPARRSRASSARRRRASSGSSRRSATMTPSRSSSPSTCSPAASASPTRICRLRDPELVAQVDRWFAERGGEAERAPRAGSIPARRRCSRPTGSAIWCSPTGSWSPRCASTAPRTGCRTTGTWCTSAAARSAAPGW